MTWTNNAASVLQVQTLIIAGPSGGLFVYNGTPAAGNLIGSWAAAAGIDAYGNTFPQGINVAGGNQATFAGPTPSSLMIAISEFGDAFARFIINADGTHAWGSGSAGSDTNLYRSSAGILHTDNSFTAGGSISAAGSGLVVSTAGGKLFVKEGAGASMGTVNLSGGAATVTTSAVTASSRIFLTSQNTGASPEAVHVVSRIPGTSFVINSVSATDSSTVAWLIVEPAP